MSEPPVFDQDFFENFEKLLVWRRDVRRFRRDPIDPSLLRDLLRLACLAPSVGNAQPWRFVEVRDPARRAAIRANFQRCNADALNDYEGEQAKLYASLKLSGLDDAPVHLAMFCDHSTKAGHGLGRKTMAETLDYSVVAAIHILWLAGRMHGVGLGWVSILDPVEATRSLDVPDDWRLIAYLCVGRPAEEHDTPELVRQGWQSREAVENFLLAR